MAKTGGRLFDRLKETIQRLAPGATKPSDEIPEPGVPGDIPETIAPSTVPAAPPAAPEAKEPDWAQEADTVSRIRKAAKTKTLLNMQYNGMWRYVEVYSFRRGKHGLLLYGYCLTHNDIHSFYMHRIQSLESTEIPYSARWFIEI